MGGGCDVFSAYSIFHELSTTIPQQIDKKEINFYFGNCTGLRASIYSHKQLTEYFYEITRKSTLEENKKYWGTSMLEESLYRLPRTKGKGKEEEKEKEKKGGFAGPYLCVVPIKKPKDELVTRHNLKTMNLITEYNSKALIDGWKHLNIDLVIAIDNGGDSITGGIDFHGESMELGRDRQVLHALHTFHEKGLG